MVPRRLLLLSLLAFAQVQGQGCSNPCCSPTTVEVALQSCKSVAECVAKFDPFCDSTSFDAQCVKEAKAACGLNCDFPPPGPPPGPPPPGPNPTVAIPALGTAEGSYDEIGVSVFSIPFAEAPVGSLRFMPPAAKAPWAGVLNATLDGHVCPQKMSPVASPWPFDAPENAQTEDCLYVNVYMPPGASPYSPFKLPVFVWLHNGNLLSGDAKTVQPSKFAERNNVIVVGVNYRLGALGFFPFPQLQPSTAGSGGLNGALDVIMALEWVQTNIGSFGGDPGAVTLGGLSSGSILTCILNVSPLAQGFFQRVIHMSGSCAAYWGPAPPELAATRAEQALAEAGLTDVPLAALQGLPVATMLELPPIAGVDGFVLTTAPLELYSTGAVNARSAFVGTVSMDGLYKTGFPPLQDGVLTEASYEATVSNVFGDQSSSILQNYPADNVPFSYYNLNQDLCVQCPTFQLKAFLEQGLERGLLEGMEGNAGATTHQHLYSVPTYTDLGAAWDNAAVHPSALTTLFGYTTQEGQFPFPEAWNSNLMMSVFGSFVATGSPQYSGPDVLDFSARGVETANCTELFLKSKCGFWAEMEPQLETLYASVSDWCSGLTGVV